MEGVTGANHLWISVRWSVTHISYGDCEEGLVYCRLIIRLLVPPQNSGLTIQRTIVRYTHSPILVKLLFYTWHESAAAAPTIMAFAPVSLRHRARENVGREWTAMVRG